MIPTPQSPVFFLSFLSSIQMTAFLSDLRCSRLLHLLLRLRSSQKGSDSSSALADCSTEIGRIPFSAEEDQTLAENVAAICIVD